MYIAVLRDDLAFKLQASEASSAKLIKERDETLSKIAKANSQLQDMEIEVTSAKKVILPYIVNI